MAKKHNNATTYRMKVIPGKLAVCRMDARSSVPRWAFSGTIASVTRTPDALSIVCAAEAVPAGVIRQADWVALMVEGPLDFSLIGVMARLATVLAGAGVALLALSTFDTDFLLVQGADLPKAIEALQKAGHTVDASAGS